MRRVAQQRAAVGEAEIEQGPAAEVMLVADGAHEERLAMIGGGLDGIQNAEAGARGVGEVKQEAAGEGIGVRQVDLESRKVAGGKPGGPVLPAGQPADGVHAVEAVEPVVKPGAPLGQRPGELQPRRPFIHMEAAIGGNSGDEIRDAEAPAVVAHLGGEVEDAGGASAIVGREAAVLHVHGLDGFDVDARLQAAGHGIGNVEAIERVVGLAGVASVEVGPAGVVLHHAVHHRQRVAVVLRRGVRDGLDFGVGEFFVIGGLLQIDGRRRIGDIDPFREFLLVVQRDGELSGGGVKPLPASLVEVEAQTLGANGVFPGGGQVQAEVAGQVGRGHHGGASLGRPQFHARSGDAGPVFIHHASRDGNLRLKAGARKQKAQDGSRTVGTPCHRGFVPLRYACLLTSIQRGAESRASLENHPGVGKSADAAR